MTWGRDTDERRGRRRSWSPSVDAGGTLRRHRCRATPTATSERLIGPLIGDVVPRDDVVLATKAGIGRVGGERLVDASRGHLLRPLDASLRRLGIDHVDLWQVHAWDRRHPAGGDARRPSTTR